MRATDAVVNDAFEFYYEGVKLTAKNVDAVVNTNNIYVKTVDTDVTIDGVLTFTVTVSVNQYVALK